MDTDDIRGREEVGFFEDFTGMSDRGVDGAFEEEFFIEVFFLVIEIEDIEVFLFLVFEVVSGSVQFRRVSGGVWAYTLRPSSRAAKSSRDLISLIPSISCRVFRV